MGAALLVLIGLGVFTSESMQTFRENSNGNPKYVISVVGDCDTGIRDSGFAYAPCGGIVLTRSRKAFSRIKPCASAWS